MSFLKQLLTPFVEFEEEAKKQPPQPAQVVPKPQAPVQTAPAVNPNNTINVPKPEAQQVEATHPLVSFSHPPDTPAQVPTFSPSGTIAAPLPEHQAYFEKLVDDANKNIPAFQGTDYKEFVDSKVDIDDITDEVLRYKTAFNVLKSTGLTREKLLDTGQAYLDLIGRDLNAFQSAHAQQYNKEVRHKESIIQKKAEELQLLAQKMNAIKGEINQLTNEIEVKTEQLNTTKNSFLMAGEIKQREIQTELEKIAQYFS